MNYSKDFKSLFEELNLSVPQMPKEFTITGLKESLEPIILKSPDNFLSYIDTEINFWQENFVLHKTVTHISQMHNRLNEAKKSFDTAHSTLHNLKDMNEARQQQAKNTCQSHLRNIKGFLVNGDDALNIYSETILARNLLKHKNASNQFFEGFFYGINNKSTFKTYNNTHHDFMFGLFAAYEYIHTLHEIDNAIPDIVADIEDMRVDFKNRSNIYLEEYDKLLEAKKHAYEQLEKKINDEEVTRSGLFGDFITDSKNDIQTLEETYRQKLKLAKPADY